MALFQRSKDPLVTADLENAVEAGHGHGITRKIAPGGESGRRGIHPIHFFRILWTSMSDASRLCNILWPTVSVALALRYIKSNLHLIVFILNYLAMFARKLLKVAGVLIENMLGLMVELIFFISAVLGSILVIMLLCLGDTVSEVGCGILLTAGLALIVPSAYYHAIAGASNITEETIQDNVLHISRVTSILLIIAYLIYIWFQMRTQHCIFDAILERDEEKDADKARDAAKSKLTLTECVIALLVSMTLVTLVAISLVEQIGYIVEERGITEAFMGLILVPLVEKAAEHLTAIDEAWDNQMNFALSHVLGATIQTALFNTPLVVIVGWGLGKTMNLNFELFEIIIMILAIVVVGNFLRDQKSNYLEGALCVIVYVIIAVSAFYYPGTSI
ncbi:hypothetical protein BT63DRAFT_466425 [Microthyrium microscopicum]|uniref:Sodium/calcium exchanger membrane region domain-containing protein n=1 Tax=Microthyrium microscopicum TaxID=703497 RepID=A0A6A6UL08_9PEZI|nr:hypothetical protein BT63DRAFT_466425 [Microthyrium microscopicum]